MSAESETVQAGTKWLSEQTTGIVLHALSLAAMFYIIIVVVPQCVGDIRAGYEVIEARHTEQIQALNQHNNLLLEKIFGRDKQPVPASSHSSN